MSASWLGRRPSALVATLVAGGPVPARGWATARLRWMSGCVLLALAGLAGVPSARGDIIVGPSIRDLLRDNGVPGQDDAGTALDRELSALATRLVDGRSREAAVDALTALSGQYPEDVRVWLMLSLAHLGRNDLKAGLAAVDRCLERDPQLAGGHLLRGMILAAGWDLPEARLAYDRAVEAKPDDPDGYLHRGRFLVLYSPRDRDQLRSAVEDLQRALALGAPPETVHGLLGMAYRGLKEPGRAEEHFRKALAANPRQVESVRELVAIHLERGEVSRAEQVLSVARPAAPELTGPAQGALAYTEAVLAQAAHARPEVVEGHFRAALAANPDDARARFRFAEWLDGQGRREETIALLRAGLSQPPMDPDLAAHLAWSLADAGKDLDEAGRLLAVARRKYGPDDPYLADTQAWVEYRRRDYAAAWAAIRKGLSLAEGNPAVAYHAGAIQAQLGNRPQAVRYLELALRRAEPFDGREEARALLERLRASPR